MELYKERTRVQEQATLLKEKVEHSLELEHEQNAQLKFYQQALDRSVIDRWLGITRYTARTLHGPAMLGPSPPRHSLSI